MKRLLLLLLFPLLSINLVAQDIDVPQVQRSLITKKTATWCPYCGDWGWVMFKGLLEDNGDKALVIAAHYSGDLTNDLSVALTQNFGGAGQPRFYLDNQEQGVSAGNLNDKREAIKAAIAGVYENTSPLAQSGLQLTLSGKDAKLQTRTRFFSAAEGTYRLGAYLIRKSLVYYQSGKGSMADHSNLLIRSLDGENFGKVIINGTAEANVLVNRHFDFSLGDDENPEDFMVATILWKENAGKFEFVNTNFTDAFTADVSTTKDASRVLGNSTRVSPNPVGNHFFLSFKLNQSIDQATIRILDLQGREQRLISSGRLASGAHNLEVNGLEDMPAGTYLLSFDLDGMLYAHQWLKY